MTFLGAWSAAALKACHSVGELLFKRIVTTTSVCALITFCTWNQNFTDGVKEISVRKECWGEKVMPPFPKVYSSVVSICTYLFNGAFIQEVLIYS